MFREPSRAARFRQMRWCSSNSYRYRPAMSVVSCLRTSRALALSRDITDWCCVCRTLDTRTPVSRASVCPLCARLRVRRAPALQCRAPSVIMGLGWVVTEAPGSRTIEAGDWMTRTDGITVLGAIVIALGSLSARGADRGGEHRLPAAALGLRGPRSMWHARVQARGVPGLPAGAAERRSSGSQAPARDHPPHVPEGGLARRRRLRPATAGSALRLQAPDLRLLRADGRARRRLQRPDRRSRSESLRRRILAARMHQRQRLLQAGQPERRSDEPAVPENHQRTGIGEKRLQQAKERSRRS